MVDTLALEIGIWNQTQVGGFRLVVRGQQMSLTTQLPRHRYLMEKVLWQNIIMENYVIKCTFFKFIESYLLKKD